MILETIPYAGFSEVGKKNIMSITVFEGFEIDLQKMKEIIAGLREWYGGKGFCLLCNRMYRFSYTYAALKELENLNDLLAMAILVHSGISYAIGQLNRLYIKNVKVFWVQAYAIEWLEDIIEAND